MATSQSTAGKLMNGLPSIAQGLQANLLARVSEQEEYNNTLLCLCLFLITVECLLLAPLFGGELADPHGFHLTMGTHRAK